jgi:excisionase family DNA binding protein
LNLTVKQLADRWQCSIAAIYKLVHSEALPFFRIGTKGLRFRLSDIEDYEGCASRNTEANGLSTTETNEAGLSDARLVRMTEPRRNEGLPTGGSFNPFAQLTPRGS